MQEKTNTNARILHKHDIEANWNKALKFVPLSGEIIVYDIDENNSTPRFKVGDGKNFVTDLPFISANIEVDDFITPKSTNPVQNRTIDAALKSVNTKAEKAYELATTVENNKPTFDVSSASGTNILRFDTMATATPLKATVEGIQNLEHEKIYRYGKNLLPGGNYMLTDDY